MAPAPHRHAPVLQTLPTLTATQSASCVQDWSYPAVSTMVQVIASVPASMNPGPPSVVVVVVVPVQVAVSTAGLHRPFVHDTAGQALWHGSQEKSAQYRPSDEHAVPTAAPLWMSLVEGQPDVSFAPSPFPPLPPLASGAIAPPHPIMPTMIAMTRTIVKWHERARDRGSFDMATAHQQLARQHIFRSDSRRSR
jgi:hypothetical protein